MVASTVLPSSGAASQAERLSRNWQENIMEVLKQLLETLPIPHNSIVDLYYGGQHGELLFRTIIHFDRDKNFTSGINPNIVGAQFQVSSVIVKLVTSKYTCKISVCPLLSCVKLCS